MDSLDFSSLSPEALRHPYPSRAQTAFPAVSPKSKPPSLQPEFTLRVDPSSAVDTYTRDPL